MVKIIFEWIYYGTNVMIAHSGAKWVPNIMDKLNDRWVYQTDLYPNIYEYKFVVDGKWVHDTSKPVVDDGYGGKNNIISIKNPDDPIRIVHISDTHSLFTSLPQGEILVHSGDFSIDGHPGEYEQFNQWLGAQKFMYKIVVLGNHDLDYMMREKIDPIAVASSKLTNAIVLSSEKINLMGINFYGIQWYWFNRWNFSYYDKQYINCEEWYKIPSDTDILITHGPPKFILDGDRDSPSGSYGLLLMIENIRPKYHLFGHIHHQYGHLTINWPNNQITHFYNSSLVSEDSNHIVNYPQVIYYNK